MKTLSSITIILAALLNTALANTPKKEPVSRYQSLWTNSPFTSKPPIVQAGPAANPLEDYTLTGIAPVPGGYRVTIVSKKNRDLKKVIVSGESGDLSIISVNRNPGQKLGTEVVLSTTSGIQGTVRFEPDLIKPKAAPAVVQNQEQNTQPPGINNPNPPINNGAAPVEKRQPRPRIAPTEPAQQNQNNPAGQGRRPDNSGNRDRPRGR